MEVRHEVSSLCSPHETTEIQKMARKVLHFPTITRNRGRICLSPQTGKCLCHALRMSSSCSCTSLSLSFISRKKRPEFLRQLNIGFKPKLCFTVLTLNMHMHSQFFPREKVKTVTALRSTVGHRLNNIKFVHFNPT